MKTENSLTQNFKSSYIRLLGDINNIKKGKNLGGKMSWYIHWDTSFDLSRGGIELSFRNRDDMSLLLVETEAIRTVNRIINKIGTPYISPRQHIIGTRGFGKSTLLNYMAHRLFGMLGNTKVIPVYASLLGKATDDKELEFIFFRSLLESLFDIPSDIGLFRLNELFSKSSDQLTKAKLEFRKQLRNFGQVSLEYVYTAFENQLSHLRETFHKVVFLIDGLDKQENGVVLKFLRNTQERLNTIINKYGCVFIDAADPSWRETLDTKEFSGVRGSPINLRVWTVDEVEALIKKRLEAIGIYQMPFERKALEILVEDFQGNPREILQYATTLLHFSAKERLATIGSGVARKIVWTNDSKEKFFNQIISNTDVRYAFEKLKTIYKERQMMNILTATYNQRGQRVSKNLSYEARSSIGVTLTDNDYQKFLVILMNKGCVKKSKVQNYVELEDDVKKLFDFVAEKGQSLVALPVVLSELEFKVENVAPPLQEGIIIKEEIQKVFEQHSSEWLNHKKRKKFLVDNPRTMKKLEEHFKEGYDKKITSTIPLIVHRLIEEGKLMQDEDSSSYRWRPSTINFKTAHLFKSKEILDLIDLGEQAIENENTEELAELCKKFFWYAFSEIDTLFGNRFKSTNTRDTVAFLECLTVNVSKPIPLKLFLSSLEKEIADIDEAKVLLRTAILYAKRIFAKIYQLRLYEPRNQEIITKLRECKTGVHKEEEREYFEKSLLTVLMKSYGKLVECMNTIKIKDGVLREVPPELTSLRDNKQILPAQLYECPICKKRTPVSAAKIEAMNCPEHKVSLIRKESVFLLSKKAYQAWNVWMEEYTKAILGELPVKYVETGIALKSIDEVGIASPEEVDLAVVFNGKSIAIECIENVTISEKKNDVTNVIHKIESLGLFDFIILIYRQVDDTHAFKAVIKKHKKFLFPIMIQSPKKFKIKLHNALKFILAQG